MLLWEGLWILALCSRMPKSVQLLQSTSGEHAVVVGLVIDHLKLEVAGLDLSISYRHSLIADSARLARVEARRAHPSETRLPEVSDLWGLSIFFASNVRDHIFVPGAT